MAAIDLSRLFKDSDLGGTPDGPRDEAIQFVGAVGTIRGYFYLAAGSGAKPTVLMLHGFPGNEQMTDMALALRRAGFNVFTFHYSGNFGSEGAFSFRNVLQDSKRALHFLQDPRNATTYGIDVNNIFVVGHSMGGFAALHTAANCWGIRGTVALTPYDFRHMYDLAQSGNAKAEQDLDRLLQYGAAWLNTDFESLRNELAAHQEYKFDALIPGLSRLPLMVVGATLDETAINEEHAARFRDLLQGYDPTDFEYRELEMTHSFLDRRFEVTKILAEKLDGWVLE